MAGRRGSVSLAGAVAVMALSAGCGGGGGAEAVTTTATTERRAQATTTTTEATPTAPTTAPAIEPPDNTGTDMVAILQSLSDFDNRLGMAPSLEAVDLAYHPGSPAHAGALAVTERLLDLGYRWSGAREQLLDIRDTGPVGTSWTLTAISSPVDAVLLDQAGNAVADQPPKHSPQRFVLQLVRGVDGRWRYFDVQPIGGPLG